jgi:hypothetical protein
VPFAALKSSWRSETFEPLPRFLTHTHVYYATHIHTYI